MRLVTLKPHRCYCCGRWVTLQESSLVVKKMIQLAKIWSRRLSKWVNSGTLYPLHWDIHFQFAWFMFFEELGIFTIQAFGHKNHPQEELISSGCLGVCAHFVYSIWHMWNILAGSGASGHIVSGAFGTCGTFWCIGSYCVWQVHFAQQSLMNASVVTLCHF